MSKPKPLIGFYEFRAVMLGCFGLSGAASRVLCALVALADKHSGLVVGVRQKQLGKESRCSDPSLREALDTLATEGLIAMALHRGTYRYELLVDAWPNPKKVRVANPRKVRVDDPKKVRIGPKVSEGTNLRNLGSTPSSPDLSGFSPASDLDLIEQKKLEVSERGVWGGCKVEHSELKKTSTSDPQTPVAQEGPKEATGDTSAEPSESAASKASPGGAQGPSLAFQLKPPTGKRRRGRKPAENGTLVPDDFAPNTAAYETGAVEGLSRRQVDRQVGKYRDKSHAKGTTYFDHQAGFRTWLGNVRQWTTDEERLEMDREFEREMREAARKAPIQVELLAPPRSKGLSSGRPVPPSDVSGEAYAAHLASLGRGHG